MSLLALVIFLDLSGVVPITDAATDSVGWTIALITVGVALRTARDSLRRSMRQASRID